METKTKNKLLIDKNHLNAILYSTNVDQIKLIQPRYQLELFKTSSKSFFMCRSGFKEPDMTFNALKQ